MNHTKLFDFGRANRIAISPIVDDDTDTLVFWWLNGRIFNHYISINLPRWCFRYD